MMHLLGGPLARQIIQIIATAVATTGVVSESEAMTLIGAITSIANIAWVVFARKKAGA